MSSTIGRFIRKSAVGLALSALAATVAAQDVQVREDRPDSYVVVRGDTLWDISGVFLENPAAWPQIWRVNPQIENPDLIYPGDIIALRYIDGRPVLELQRGGGTGDAVIRLSPGIRYEPLSGGVGQIRLEDISSLLSRNRVLDPEVVDESGYVLGNRAGNLFASDGQVVIARGDWQPNTTSYAVVRPRRTFTHPRTGDVIGVEVEEVGEVRVMDLDEDNDVATMRVRNVAQEMRKSDRIVQQDRNPIESIYQPDIPDFEVDEFVLGFADGTEYGGTGDTVILSGGGNTRLEVGHLVTIRKADVSMVDEIRGDTVTVPGESYATAMIYRVFDSASFALVLNSSSQIETGDQVGIE